MRGHPGGEAHSRDLIGRAALEPGSRWLDMGAGAGETLRILESLGYDVVGIDLEPRDGAVLQGDFRKCPWENSSFDGIISQCSFYISGHGAEAIKEAGRLLRKGGRLVFSDVTENPAELENDCRRAGFAVEQMEDLTPQWREYYLEMLWTQDDVCIPRGKKFSYVLMLCERM